MQKRTFSTLLTALLVLIIGTGCGNLTDSNQNTSQDQVDAAQSAIIYEEYAQLDASPDAVIDADVIFTLGWKKHMKDGEIALFSDAFAVAPLPVDTPDVPKLHSGQDIGDVLVHFGGESAIFRKTEMRNGGIFYSLNKFRKGPKGHRGPKGGPHGNSFSEEDIVVVPYEPGATYGFEYTGAGEFSATTVEITAPEEGLALSSPAAGDSIDLTIDLNVSWTGGQAEQPVMVVLRPERGKRGGHKDERPVGGKSRGGKDWPKGDQSFGSDDIKHEHFRDFGLRYKLDTNTGEFTIPAEDLAALAELQDVVGEGESIVLHVGVMQMVTSEVTENGLVHALQLRISDGVPVSITQ
jgi:hypothetical protein